MASGAGEPLLGVLEGWLRVWPWLMRDSCRVGYWTRPGRAGAHAGLEPNPGPPARSTHTLALGALCCLPAAQQTAPPCRGSELRVRSKQDWGCREAETPTSALIAAPALERGEGRRGCRVELWDMLGSL